MTETRREREDRARRLERAEEAEARRQLEARQIRLLELRRRLKARKDWLERFNAKQIEIQTCPVQHVLVSGGAQYGKSEGGRGVIYHDGSGLYPTWWGDGRRCIGPTVCAWISEDFTKARDHFTDLFLGPDGNRGTGLLPPEMFVDPRRDIVEPKAGTRPEGSVEKFYIKHFDAETRQPDGMSRIDVRALSAGRRKGAGYPYHCVVFDDAPAEEKVHNQVLQRTVATQGRSVTNTVLDEGSTPLYESFLNDSTGMRKLIYMTVHDATHLSEEQRDKIIRTFQGTFLEMPMLYGLPPTGGSQTLGHQNAIQACVMENEEFVAYDRLVWLGCIDVPHTTGRFAAVLLAYDRDLDMLYVVKTKQWQGVSRSAMCAWMVENMHFGVIPVAWPCDASGKWAEGEKLRDALATEGLKMMDVSAHYRTEVANKISRSTAAAFEETKQRIEKMKIRFLRQACEDGFTDAVGAYRLDPNQAKRNRGRIIDRVDALFKGVMMLRFAEHMPTCSDFDLAEVTRQDLEWRNAIDHWLPPRQLPVPDWSIDGE